MSTTRAHKAPFRFALRALATVILCMGFGTAGFAADAGKQDLVITSVKGDVRLSERGEPRTAQKGNVVELSATIRTGRASSIELKQGQTTVAAGADTQLDIPATAVRGDLLERVVQSSGNTFYSVAKRGAKKFRVETPYLVAVVKGTQFNVAVQEDAATVSLFEGSLEIRSADGSDVVNIEAGQIAVRRASETRIRVLRMDTGEPVAQRTDSNAGAGAAVARNADESSATVAGSATGDARTSIENVALNTSSSSGGREPAATKSTSTRISIQSAEVRLPAVRADADLVDRSVATAGIAANVDVATDLGAASVTAGINAGVDLGAGSITAGVNTGVDLGAASVTAGVGAAVDLGVGTIDTGVAAGVDLGAASVTAGVGAAVDLGTGTIDTGVAAGVDLGGASVTAGVSTGVDLGAGAVDVGVGAGADLGSVTAGLGAGASADLGSGTLDIGAGAGVDAGAASVTAGLDTGVDLGAGSVSAGLDTGVDLGGTGAGLTADTGVDLSTGTIDTSAGVTVGDTSIGAGVDVSGGGVSAGVTAGGLDLGLGLDLGGGGLTLDVGSTTSTSSGTTTTSGSTAGSTSGGLLGGLLGGLGGRRGGK
jgi:hypothetical protein